MKDDEKNSEGGVFRDILLAQLTEQRRARRWNYLYKFGWLIIIFMIVYPLYSIDKQLMSAVKPSVNESHVALVTIDGVISANDEANYQNVVAGVRRAMESDLVEGVILKINSPGGSPVQSKQIFTRISQLKAKHKKPVYVFIEDVGASAAYLISCVGDEIYCDEASLVGSIGVLVNGFGFNDAISKLGVQRRLYTSGKLKGGLDPFSPVNEEAVGILQEQLNIIHQQFIDVVKSSRKDKLDLSNDLLFSGMAWTGTEAKKLGLVDDFSTLNDILETKFEDKKLVDYTESLGFFDKLSSKISASFENVFSSYLSFKM